MKQKNTTQKIVTAALLASLTCVATMIIKIPSPLKGYINIGDCVVLLAAWSLSPLYGFLAAGLGSALADIFSGYVVYAPATFLIKGVMALIACCGVKILSKKAKSFTAQIISAAAAEIWMGIGYFLFEGVLYGFAPAAVNIPANCIQGLAGLILGCVLVRFFEKNKISFK